MKRSLLFTSALALSGALLLAGCTADAGAETDAGDEIVASSADVFSGDLAPDAVLADNADATVVRDDEWSASDAVDVELSGSGASEAEGVTVDGSTVTISEAGVYRLSGSLDGGVVVAAPDDALVVLILDGVDISNDAGAAIAVQSADDVAIFLEEGSDNRVSDAGSYTAEAGANAAIWADTDLTISGTGSLTVTGNGNDGISSTDDLAILSGEITVTAADDALRGKDSLVVEGGSLDLTATGGDGLKSDGTENSGTANDQEDDPTKGYVAVSGGTVEISAGDDGVQAWTDVVITGGTIGVDVADDGIKGETIVSVGGGEVVVTRSTEAMEAANIGVFAGTIDLTASDDGINGSGLNTGQDREADTGERVEISGGAVTIAAGKDGIDSNGSVTVSGGTVVITSAANGGDGPIDANGELSVADGAVTANGSPWDESMATGMGGPGMGGGPGGGQVPGGGQMPGGGQVPGGQGSGQMPGQPQG